MRSAGAAYREQPTREEAVSAPVVLEVALVRAGRVLGRRPSMRGGLRLVASTVVVAGLLGVGGWVGSQPVYDDEDPPTRDQVYAMQLALAAVAEREQDEDVDPFDLQGREDYPVRPRSGWTTWHGGVILLRGG
jgi:hypothetical protein